MAEYTFRFDGPGAHFHDGRELKIGDEFTTPLPLHKTKPQKFSLVEQDSGKRRVSQRNKALQTPPEENTGEAPRSQLQIKNRGHGWYDVVDGATGEKVNDNSLRYDDALKLTEE